MPSPHLAPAPPATPAGPTRGRIHPAWIVAGVTFITLLGAAGFRSAPGVLLVPLHDELGWSREWISAAVAVNLVLFGLVGPFAAALMNRHGLRRVVLAALTAVALAALGTTAMTEPWQLVLLWGVVVGIGSGCMATVLAATVAARWFVAQRGLVTGALTAATATGQLLFLPLLGRLAEGVGWRWVSVAVATGALAVLGPVALWLHDKPEDLGARAYGATGTPEPAAPAGHPVAAALGGLVAAVRSRVFWLLGGSFFVCGVSTNGLVGTHFIAAAHDHAIGEANAATWLAVVGVLDVVGTVASGWLTDRVDPRRLLLAYYGLRGLSLLALHDVLGGQGAGLALFAVFYGVDWVATVPPTVALVHRTFPAERAGVVYGWVFTAHQLGAAAAAFGAGAVREATGSYQPAFLAAAALCVAAALAVQLIRDRDRDRERARPTPAVGPPAGSGGLADELAHPAPAAGT